MDDTRYVSDLDEVYKRAYESGVGGFIIPGATPETLKRAIEISHKYENTYFSVGVHPYDIDSYDRD